jgi:hypothetical protein
MLDLDTMRHVHRYLDTEFADLIDWQDFSLEAVRTAVAARMGGEITIAPFHWETRAYFGLTIGYRSQGGPRWLIVYEQEAVAEHHLMIVLHELVHVALGHCGAGLTSDELRTELTQLGLISRSDVAVTYARTCALSGNYERTPDDDRQEAEAELGAAWILTRARSVGRVPRSGQSFSAEHTALSRVLGDMGHA